MEQKIEAILFYKNEPVEIKKLISLLDTNEECLLEALQNLNRSLEKRGTSLIMTAKEDALGTSKETSSLIEKIAKEDMEKELGKAGLETLAIILYNKKGVSRKKIDYIRGVNSAFILRNLRTRGLIEKAPDDENSKNYIYKPTIALLAHIGITDQTQMPDFFVFSKKIEGANEEENL